jgi:hypothetical protein
MLAFGADVLLEHYVPNLKLAWNYAFVIVLLYRFLVLLNVGQCRVTLLF